MIKEKENLLVNKNIVIYILIYLIVIWAVINTIQLNKYLSVLITLSVVISLVYLILIPKHLMKKYFNKIKLLLFKKEIEIINPRFILFSIYFLYFFIKDSMYLELTRFNSLLTIIVIVITLRFVNIKISGSINNK